MLTLPTGETLQAAPDTQIIATMNGTPDQLPDALANRFPVKILCDIVNPLAIATLPEDLRDAALSLAVHEDPDRRVGLRDLVGFADLRSHVAGPVAAQAVWGERASDVLDALTIRASADATPEDE